MTTDTANVLVGEGWRDGLEAGVRGRIRGFIEELLEEELTTALGRARYARTRARERLASTVKGSGSDGSDAADELPIAGHRNGHRDRQVMGTFGALVVLGVRADGQKVLVCVRNMGGESEAAWRAVLDDLVRRGLKRPELAIVDGAPGLEAALSSLWSDLLVQRCTVHKL